MEQILAAFLLICGHNNPNRIKCMEKVTNCMDTNMSLYRNPKLDAIDVTKKCLKVVKENTPGLE